MKDVQGDFPDYTCALFKGDFGKSLQQAQEDKHEWIFEGLTLSENLPRTRLLDIGCGWGPILNAVRKRAGSSVGLTLSSNQHAYCRERGLETYLEDYKALRNDEFGVFDGIVSLGAFEHFCSVEEMLAGKQEEIYRGFFRVCAERLPSGRRLYLQTMTWGKDIPDPRTFSLDAPADTPEAILARLEFVYPGSWLPNGLEQIVECASEHFDFVESNNGRLDYIETIRRWNAAMRNLWKPHLLPRAAWHGAKFAYRVLTDHASRIQWKSIRCGDNSACFERKNLSPERIFFKRK